MAGRLVALAAALLLAAVAARAEGDPGHAPYVRALVARVAGTNTAYAQIRWDYQCFEDQLGEATYEWSLRMIRHVPKPLRNRLLLAGTSKSGKTRVLLQPGIYQLAADPFRCTTERGAESTAPEPGESFLVPNFCAWAVTAGTGRAGRTLTEGDDLRPGETVLATSQLTLESRGGGGRVQLSRRSRLSVDAHHCEREGGWRVRLRAGKARVEISRKSDPRRRYRVESPHAVMAGRGSVWLVETEDRETRVNVLRGTVVVRPFRGRTQRVRAGSRTAIRRP